MSDHGRRLTKRGSSHRKSSMLRFEDLEELDEHNVTSTFGNNSHDTPDTYDTHAFKKQGHELYQPANDQPFALSNSSNMSWLQQQAHEKHLRRQHKREQQFMQQKLKHQKHLRKLQQMQEQTQIQDQQQEHQDQQDQQQEYHQRIQHLQQQVYHMKQKHVQVVGQHNDLLPNDFQHQRDQMYQRSNQQMFLQPDAQHGTSRLHSKSTLRSHQPYQHYQPYQPYQPHQPHPPHQPYQPQQIHQTHQMHQMHQMHQLERPRWKQVPARSDDLCSDVVFKRQPQNYFPWENRGGEPRRHVWLACYQPAETTSHKLSSKQHLNKSIVSDVLSLFGTTESCFFGVFVSSQNTSETTPGYYDHGGGGFADDYVHETRSDFETCLVKWALFVLSSKSLGKQTEDRTIDVMLSMSRAWGRLGTVKWYQAQACDLKTSIPLPQLLAKSLEVALQSQQAQVPAKRMLTSYEELAQHLSLEAIWAACANEAAINVSPCPHFYI